MMCKPTGKYPGFHKIEIIAELETPVGEKSAFGGARANYLCEPRIENNDLFGRFIPKNVYTPGSVLIRKLSGNSAVVSFYSNAWRTYGLKYLREVNQLQYVIGALGGQLTIVEPNEPEVDPAVNIGSHGFNLHFYFDPADLVSDRFRIYPKDFNDPICNPGDGNNIVRLADYIIDNFYKVVRSHMDTRQNLGVRRSELQYA
jgi:hypothetical protein